MGLCCHKACGKLEVTHFMTSSIQRVVECVVSVGLAATFARTIYRTFESGHMVVSAVATTLFGGILGRELGITAGPYIVPAISKVIMGINDIGKFRHKCDAITSTKEENQHHDICLGFSVVSVLSNIFLEREKYVRHIGELIPWDHIVVPGKGLCHSRCHALVTNVDYSNSKVRVIQKLSTEVVERDLHFPQLMRKIDHPRHKSNPRKFRLARTRAHLGESPYNFVFDNCKQFVLSCIELKHYQP